jgi:hypothetical protein
MGSSLISIGSRCPSPSSCWLFSCHSEMMAKQPIRSLCCHWLCCRHHRDSTHQTHGQPCLTPPSTLPLKHFLLHRLLSLIRVLLLYSSPRHAFCRPLLSCHLPASVTTLPLPSSLQCPDASHCKTLTLTFMLTAFALRC